MANPCGISTTDILKIIREEVEKNNTTTTRKDIVNQLIVEGKLSVSEANSVATLYYKQYKAALLEGAKTELSNVDRALQKNAEKYLSLEANSPMLSEEELADIKKQYTRAKAFRDAGANDKATTIESDVATMLLSKQPDKANLQLFEGFIFTKPLVSARFLQASAWSNLMVNITRVASAAFSTKGGIDLRPISKILGSDYGFLKARSVLEGGITAMDIQSLENNNITNARPQNIKQVGKINNLMAWSVRFGKKLIDVPDTFGIITGVDLHYRTIITNNKYNELRAGGMDRRQAGAASRFYADNAMVKMADNEARKIADNVFTQDNVTVDDKFRKSVEYRLAVEEIKRSNRDPDTIQTAFLRSSEDYFKTRMTQRSEFGIFTDGIFGAFARGMGAIKDNLTKSAEGQVDKGNLKTAKFEKAASLGIFGFLNGASAFAERSLEAIPIYGLTKMALMQIDKKGKNQEISTAIAQKQRDVLTNMMVGVVMYGMLRAIKAIAEENCDSIRVPESKIYGRYRTTICGKQIMPFIIPSQFEALFGFYNWLLDTNLSDKATSLTTDAIGSIAMLLSNARMGNETPSAKFVKNINEGVQQKKLGNNIASDEYYNKAANDGVGIVINYANSFLPIPLRPIQELGSYLKPTQKQTRPVFDIKDPESLVKTVANSGAMQLGNIISLTSYVSFFAGNPKPLLDWQGREVMNTRAGYWVGEGIQYDKYDDLFAQARVPLPYLSPYTDITVTEKETGTYKSPLTSKSVIESDVAKKYLDENEFFNLQKGVSEFNKEFFTREYNTYKSYNPERLKNELERYNKRIKQQAFKGIEEGIKPENIKGYLQKKMQSTRDLTEKESAIMEYQ